jgi:hypothetical protein
VNTRCGCQTATRDRDSARRTASHWSRGNEITGWTVPSATFALLGQIEWDSYLPERVRSHLSPTLSPHRPTQL